MKSNLRQALKVFHQLPKAGQDSLLRDPHKLTAANALMIENRLLGNTDFTDLIRKMERETIGKVYKKGIPGTPNGRTINAIINSAKKSRAPAEIILELEQLAYRGFIGFLHEYGGGPDNFLDLGPKHLEAYLKLVQKTLPKTQQDQIFENVRKYLLKKDNMITDYTDEAFESVTGVPVR